MKSSKPNKKDYSKPIPKLVQIGGKDHIIIREDNFGWKNPNNSYLAEVLSPYVNTKVGNFIYDLIGGTKLVFYPVKNEEIKKKQ